MSERAEWRKRCVAVEYERDTYRAILAGVHGALLDAGSIPVPDMSEPLDEAVRALVAERDAALVERDELRAEQAESDLRAVREIHRIEVGVLRDERDKALDMVAEIGKPLGVLSMPQVHRNADVVKALRQREIAAKETIKRLSDGIMQCIDASWCGTRSLDWTHIELILAEYVGDLRAERAAADEALAACQSQGYAAVANLYALCQRMVRQKTDMQRDVLMCHATRIANHAGIPTGVMAMLRDATPTDVPALIAERDAALAERDEARQEVGRLNYMAKEWMAQADAKREEANTLRTEVAAARQEAAAAQAEHRITLDAFAERSRIAEESERYLANDLASVRAEVTRLYDELGRVSEELGLPRSVGPAPGWLKQQMAALACLQQERDAEATNCRLMQDRLQRLIDGSQAWQQGREGLIALAAYADHLDGCGWRDGNVGEPCSCGLDALQVRLATPPTETQEPTR